MKKQSPIAITKAPPEVSQQIEVQARKYDNRIHRRWVGRVEEWQGSMIVLNAKFEDTIEHPLLGTIVPGTLSTEYYWTDRWYNVFRFCEPTGEFRNYYCNINTPAEFDGNVLSFVDLDIDVLVAPDFSVQILDRDEFAANAARYGYSNDTLQRADKALDELLTLITERRFPFSGSC